MKVSTLYPNELFLTFKTRPYLLRSLSTDILSNFIKCVDCDCLHFTIYAADVCDFVSFKVRKNMIDRVSGTDTFDMFVIRMDNVSSSLRCTSCQCAPLMSKAAAFSSSNIIAVTE